MLFFKSKAKREKEKEEKEWYELVAKAIRQLNSSKFDVGQAGRFRSFIQARRYDSQGLEILRALTEAKLFDGTPLLSKFFIYSNQYSHKCSIGIHDSAIVSFIDNAGFLRVEVGKLDADTIAERVKYINEQYMSDSSDVVRLTEWCDKFYKKLETLKALIDADKTILMPQFSKLHWTGYDFTVETLVRPDRLDAIIEYLKPLSIKYLNEYRNYLIACMANDSINTSATVPEKKIRNIQFDYPETAAITYTEFEVMHKVRLNREAKNLEYKSVIDEIRAAAEEKVKKND